MCQNLGRHPSLAHLEKNFSFLGLKGENLQALFFPFSVLPERKSPIKEDEEVKIIPSAAILPEAMMPFLKEPSLGSLAIFLHYMDEARPQEKTSASMPWIPLLFVLSRKVENPKKWRSAKSGN